MAKARLPARKLTAMQIEVLAIVREAPRGAITISDIAYCAQTTPQAVGRVVSALSARGLIVRQRFGTAPWEITPREDK